jgi:protein-L-isoaspartate(D-aspartate) O-methyltransferase
MARQVHTIERHTGLAEHARRILGDLQLDNVQVHTGDGSQGLEAFAPYQGILVTAAAPQVPQPLLEQLAEDGRLVIPVGSMGAQILECWRRKGENYERDCNIAVAFMPLRGEYGWQEERWRLF